MYHLPHISHISNFHYTFQNQISTSLKSFGVLSCMLRMPFRYLFIISHISHKHLAHFKFLLCVSKFDFYPSQVI